MRNASRLTSAMSPSCGASKVVMWYASGNRDETAIPRASEFLIDRADAREHLALGWGIHFRVDSRLAEMQLRILWGELLKWYRLVEVGGEPMRVRSNFAKGFHRLRVRLHTHGWSMHCVRTGHALTDWHELDLVD